jgi:hypothetical protein
MFATIKKIVRLGINRLGYDVVPIEVRSTLLCELAACRAMRKIHCHDAVEIEELYRQFIFSQLPRREGRSELLNDLIGTSIGEAVYIIHCLHEALRIGGDICEFGVAQGATSRLLAAEIMPLSERKLWLFDSFEGLPAPKPEDKLIDDIFGLGSMELYKGTMASPEAEVLSKLDAIQFPRKRTKIRKGWISDTVKNGDLPSEVAFAYVDFDFYEPITDALDFLDSRMRAGARIVVDDYGFFSEGAKLAVDQFVARVENRFKFEMPIKFAGHFCMLSKVI